MKPNTDDPRIGLELRHCVVGPWSLNAYALICPTSGQSVLIDPGAEPPKLEEMLAGSRPVAIMVTHGHPDHIGALEELRRRLNVPLMAWSGAFGGGKAMQTDHRLQDGDRLPLGRHHLRIFHTPGHTADQISIAPEGDHRIVVGDTIFEGGPGKTWSSRDFQRTLETLRHIVLAWPDETICYPGHGPSFCLADRRTAIEGFLQKDHGAFYGDATWEM